MPKVIGARAGFRERQLGRPDPRQAPRVPHGDGGVIGKHRGPSFGVHGAVVDLFDIVGEQRQPVGIVAQEIRLDQPARHRFRRLARQARGAQDIFGKGAQRPRIELRAHPSLALVRRRTEMCQGMSSRSARVTTPNSSRPRMVRKKMPAKARSGRMLPVTIWM